MTVRTQPVMPNVLAGFAALPPNGLAAVIVLLLYAVESEIRFGAKARSIFAGPADRGSTLAVSLAAAVPVLGFVLAMKSRAHASHTWIPSWFGARGDVPAQTIVVWVGVAAALLGVVLRLWALLTLRERYTRTLRTGEDQAIERGGPYRFVRHPGYLGSLLCLNGVAAASGNAVALVASLGATIAAQSVFSCFIIRKLTAVLPQLRYFGDTCAKTLAARSTTRTLNDRELRFIREMFLQQYMDSTPPADAPVYMLLALRMASPCR